MNLPSFPNVRKATSISDLWIYAPFGAEQNVGYFIDYGLSELKVFSQVITSVLLSKLGFIENPISDAVCDLRRIEALAHQLEQGGPQGSPPLARAIT
jgi:hypothetical protein